jgi:hypothetical protein
VVLPRLPSGGPGPGQRSTGRGDTVVLTTATNRFITELTAQGLGIEPPDRHRLRR